MTDHSELNWEQRLEELRRSSRISIDAQGRWSHEAVRFEHSRIVAALDTGLDWSMTDGSTHEPLKDCFDQWSGEATVRLGEQWCYVTSDVTPFLVTKIHADHQLRSLVAILNNHERWPLRLIALRDDVLFTRLAPHRLARFSVDAQSQCAQWLTQGQDDIFALEWGAHRWVIQDSLSTST